MAKYIGITMRQEICESYNETRDQIDISFYKLLSECGLLPVLLPNNRKIVDEYLESIAFCGFILSGGGLPYPYTDGITERDYIEKRIISFAKVNELPVLGICRGMQALVVNHGAELVKVNNHVAVTHMVKDTDGNQYPKNSFHGYAMKEKNEDISVMAVADDNVIESVLIKDTSLYGIMWHPERKEAFDDDDIKLIRKVFKAEKS